MKDSFLVKSKDELAHIADILFKKYPKNRIFALNGTMGAGKTTFMKYICLSLGSKDLITSPTFSIVNEYISGDHSPIYHFDFYRINKLEEAIQIGFDEYLQSGYYCFIEWPQNIASLLPDDTVTVEFKLIEKQNKVVRVIEF